MADKKYPERGARDWYDGLREYLEPDAVAVTLTTGNEITALGSVNEWVVPAPVTITLPSTPLGAAVTVFVSNLSRITWPAGTTVIGGGATVTEAVLTLMRMQTGWRVLVASNGGGGGGGLPRRTLSNPHPLFSADNSSLADFNDFFGLDLTARPLEGALFPYLGLDGGIWFMWKPTGSNVWKSTSLEIILHQAISMSPLKAGLGSSTTLTKPPGLAPGAGFVTVVGLAIPDMFGYPADWRESRYQTPIPIPTAVTNYAALAPYSGDPSTDAVRILPYGVSVFVTSLGKPLWKKNATQWVDATGTVVTSG